MLKYFAIMNCENAIKKKYPNYPALLTAVLLPVDGRREGQAAGAGSGPHDIGPEGRAPVDPLGGRGASALLVEARRSLLLSLELRL